MKTHRYLILLKTMKNYSTKLLLALIIISSCFCSCTLMFGIHKSKPCSIKKIKKIATRYELNDRDCYLSSKEYCEFYKDFIRNNTKEKPNDLINFELTFDKNGNLLGLINNEVHKKGCGDQKFDSRRLCLDDFANYRKKIEDSTIIKQYSNFNIRSFISRNSFENLDQKGDYLKFEEGYDYLVLIHWETNANKWNRISNFASRDFNQLKDDKFKIVYINLDEIRD